MTVDAMKAAASENSAARSQTLGIAVPIFVVSLLVYLMTLSRNQGVAEDALDYVLSVDKGYGPNLFHPNHLLYNFLGWLGLRFARLIGYSGDALLVMQVISALSGAMCLTVIYGLSFRVLTDRLLAGIVTMACAGSYAFWWYSVEADTYITPLLFVMIAARLFVESIDAPLIRGTAPIAGLLALASLFHQQHVFSVFAFSVAAFWFGSGAWRQRLLKPIAITVIAGLITLGVYLIVGFCVQGLSGISNVILWARGHASDGLWTPFSAISLVKSAVGIVSAIYGLDYVFAIDAVNTTFHKMFPTTVFDEELFLASRLSTATIVLSFLSVAVSIAAWLWLAVGWAQTNYNHTLIPQEAFPSGQRQLRRRMLVLCVSFVGMQAFIITIWHPINLEFWIAILPFAYILAALAITRSLRSDLRIAAGLFAAGLTLANAIGAVLPKTERTNDYWFALNERLLNALEPGDLIVTEGGYVSNTYVQYFGPKNVEIATTGRMPISEVRRMIAQHEGRILFSAWAFSPPRSVLISGQLTEWKPEDIKALQTEFAFRLRPFVDDPYQPVWILTSAAP